MGRKKGSLKKRVARWADLAPEAAGSTRMTMIDASSVFLENHRGVLEYTDRRVVLGLEDGQMAINGSDLVLAHFGKDNAAVRGDIVSVVFEKND